MNNIFKQLNLSH